MSQPSSRRGPDLPYSLVAGVTPCRGGWLVAAAKLQGTIFAPEDPTRMEAFIDVVDMRPGYSVIALNAPRGGLEQATGVAERATAKHEPCWAGVAPPSRARRSTSIQREGTELLPDTSTRSARPCSPAIGRSLARWPRFASGRSTR